MRAGYFCIFLLFVSVVGAAPIDIQTGSGPVDITSDSLSYSDKAHQIVFSSNVHVIKDTFSMWADTLTVDLNAERSAGNATGSLGSDSIKKITGKGNVRLKSADGREGSCDVITYHANPEMVVMEGNAVLKEGLNTLSGQTITLYSKENRVVVKSGKQRVKAVFYQDNKTKGK